MSEERKVIEDRNERTLREVIAKVEEESPETLDKHSYILLTIDPEDPTTGTCAMGATVKESITMVASMINQVSISNGNPYIPEYYIEELETVKLNVITELSKDIIANTIAKGEKDESEN